MQQVPSRGRAVMCLFLNVIVFPGLGTLLSGEPARKRTGMVQLGLGALLLPLVILAGMGTALFGGADPETARAWLLNFMLILVVWNLVTGIKICRDAWRRPPSSSSGV